MMFIRRDRRTGSRFTNLRVGLFFLAAGLWLAGVSVDNRIATGAGIGVALVAILLGLLTRRRDPAPELEVEEGDEE
jgi:di/tricarboxylate transporter